MKIPAFLFLAAAAGAIVAARAHAEPERRVVEGGVVDTLATVEVVDSFERQALRYKAASQGAIPAVHLALKPVYRVGEMLESVPGLITTQHSGEGKANQYYLRGFNLDHGTDLALAVAGIPVNMPTHGHGQGYADLSFVIPELVSGVEYRKGTYWADEGDFAAAGAARISYANRLDRPLARVTWSGSEYQRVLLGGSAAAAGGDLLAAVDWSHNDGPWVHPDDYTRVSGLLRWGWNGPTDGLRFTAMGYDGRWNSTDQIPARAVDDGSLPRYGTIDPSDGGRSWRYSLSGEWQRAERDRITQVMAYALDYRMQLWSNFTYYLDDPVNGDQFEQYDDRTVAGLRASHGWKGAILGLEAENTAGLQVRHDAIDGVGLYATLARERIGTVREDRVGQTSVSPWAQTSMRLAPKVRAMAGLRGDLYWFDVESDDPRNSGTADASMLSPKLSLTFGPWAHTAFFANAGSGFHSNDARGSTITVDPKTGDPAEKVSPLVRATGFEVGARTDPNEWLTSTLSLWLLDLESELVFVGDAGTTEAGRPSRRVGAEWTLHWHATDQLFLDVAYAYSRARFRDEAPEGDQIPGAVQGVASVGAEVTDVGPLFAALRYRYFGPRPLVEDGSVESAASHMTNLMVGSRLWRGVSVSLDVFNLFDSRVSDIDYYYDSRLPGEAAEGVADIHYHPAPPRTFRLALTANAW